MFRIAGSVAGGEVIENNRADIPTTQPIKSCDFFSFDNGMLPAPAFGSALVGVLDQNGDGWTDLLFESSVEHGYGRPHVSLYRNVEGRSFADITKAVGVGNLEPYVSRFAAADYDGDGNVDLAFIDDMKIGLLVGDGGKLRNLTGARIRNCPENVAELGAIAWVDYDMDLDLDLVVTGTELNKCHPCPSLVSTTQATTEPVPFVVPVFLLQNQGAGRLVDVTAGSDLNIDAERGIACIVDDFNADFRPDLFIPRWGPPHLLFMNRGNGGFDEVGREAGCAFGPGQRPSFAADAATAYLKSSGAVTLFVVDEHGPLQVFERDPVRGVFLDVTNEVLPRDLEIGIDGQALACADFNLDGHDDIVLAASNASNYNWGFYGMGPRPFLLLNDGKGRFLPPCRLPIDPADPFETHRLFVADIDHDGDTDVLSADSSVTACFRNDLPPGNNAIRIRLRGDAPNTDAIGAMVFCVTDPPAIQAASRPATQPATTAPADGDPPPGPHRQLRFVRSGGSMSSQSELPLTFGLGQAAEAAIDVRWPDGRADVFGKLPAGFAYSLGPGKKIISREPLRPRSGATTRPLR